MNHKILIVAILSLASSSALATGYDDRYLAVGGDMDGDGDIDVLVKRAPEIVILHGDIITPIVLPGNVSDTVLVNNGDSTFSLNALSQLSQAARSIARTWQTEVGSLKIGDFNRDGAYDVYVDLPQSNFNLAVDDVIVYAPPGGAGMPIAQTRVDTAFYEFFDQIDKWAQDPNYFDDNAPTTTQSLPQTTGAGWYYYATSNSGLNGALAACFLDHGSNCVYYIGYLRDVFSLAECASLFSEGISCDRFGGHVFGYSETTVFVDVEVPDYSGFNQDALALAQGVLKNVIAAGGIIAGSSDAEGIADILEGILGVIIYGGVFRDSNVVLDDEQDLDDDVNEFRRLRWLLEQLFVILSYLSEEGSPDDGGGSIAVPILLTFDDGPQKVSALTGIVTALAVENIKADFYVIGQEVQAKPAETAALIPLGHRVQNHTWSHPGVKPTIPLPQQTQAQVNAEIGDAQAAIISATSVSPTRFRAPYGIGGAWNNVDPKIQAAADMYDLDVIYWDVDTEDWKNDQQGLNGRTIPASVLEAKAYALRRPGISRVNVLMHVQSSTAKGLVPFIEALKLAGFSFVDPP